MYEYLCCEKQHLVKDNTALLASLVIGRSHLFGMTQCDVKSSDFRMFSDTDKNNGCHTRFTGCFFLALYKSQRYVYLTRTLILFHIFV